MGEDGKVCSTDGCDGRPIRGYPLCAHCFVKTLREEDERTEKHIGDDIFPGVATCRPCRNVAKEGRGA